MYLYFFFYLFKISFFFYMNENLGQQWILFGNHVMQFVWGIIFRFLNKNIYILTLLIWLCKLLLQNVKDVNIWYSAVFDFIFIYIFRSSYRLNPLVIVVTVSWWEQFVNETKKKYLFIHIEHLKTSFTTINFIQVH